MAAFNPVAHATDALRGAVLGTGTVADTATALAAATVLWVVVTVVPDKSSRRRSPRSGSAIADLL
jgi:ABC-2 type transport system permease protein